MRILSFLFLLPLFTLAQRGEMSSQFCQEGKIRYYQQLASNPKARMAYPGDTSIDVTYYGLDLRLTYSPNNLRGAATLTLKSTTDHLTSFFLDLNSTTATTGEGLRVDSVKTGQQKLTFRHAQNQLTITPIQPLMNGQALTLTVFYQGIPNSSAGSFRFGRHDNTTDPAIWTLSEPYGAPNWFPCRDTPADKADSSSVRITAPSQFVSVSNGNLISTSNNADGTRMYYWKNSYPIAQYLISIALSNYERYDTPFAYGNQTMPVTHYIYPETLPTIRATLDLTPKILQVLSDRFGPYPFLREKYGHAQFGLGNGGMEHQTLSSMEARAFTPGVIAHEMAHQWFGDKITCRDWQNIWLNEGFASYAEALYSESVNSQAGYQTTMNSFMASARTARGSLYVQDISNVTNIFSSNRTYAKGATVLHMLRGVVGDSLFFRIMRTYASSPTVAYKTAVTEDFQAVAQQVSGQNLAPFFKQWIYGEGYPTYRATIAAGSSTATATIRLEQRNTTATTPTSFMMPVQIRVQSTAGDTIVTVLNDQADQTFIVPTRGSITGVRIDPNNWILKTVESSTVVTALSEPPLGNLRVYPNPTTEILTVDFTVPKTSFVTLSLTNQFGQRVGTISESNLTAGKYTRLFSLRGLSAGRYTISVETSGGRQSQRIIVQ